MTCAFDAPHLNILEGHPRQGIVPTRQRQPHSASPQRIDNQGSDTPIHEASTPQPPWQQCLLYGKLNGAGRLKWNRLEIVGDITERIRDEPHAQSPCAESSALLVMSSESEVCTFSPGACGANPI